MGMIVALDVKQAGIRPVTAAGNENTEVKDWNMTWAMHGTQ